eukprot:CAMPEP_0185702052 /NCGR_PEP_ID=MMETSP1164-20130828/11005_1 /TAXON_ID=1104430 /ORGANISM="Chrysoreinhardia sp, Strain CCMP2950" /LENGTH=161 /DNA_ID=CAMNT_0028369205 /DNA_START=5 /DNA_END=487 /DNA_ORIENTATION=+
MAALVDDDPVSSFAPAPAAHVTCDLEGDPEDPPLEDFTQIHRRADLDWVLGGVLDGPSQTNAQAARTRAPGPKSTQIGGRRVPRGLMGPWWAARRGGTGAALWGVDCGGFSRPCTLATRSRVRVTPFSATPATPRCSCLRPNGRRRGDAHRRRRRRCSGRA